MVMMRGGTSAVEFSNSRQKKRFIFCLTPQELVEVKKVARMGATEKELLIWWRFQR